MISAMVYYSNNVIGYMVILFCKQNALYKYTFQDGWIKLSNVKFFEDAFLFVINTFEPFLYST